MIIIIIISYLYRLTLVNNSVLLSIKDMSKICMDYRNKHYIDYEDEILKVKVKFFQKVLNLEIEVSHFSSSVNSLKIFAP